MIFSHIEYKFVESVGGLTEQGLGFDHVCNAGYLTIIPQARMGSESEAIRARGIILFSKIQVVGQKY